MDYIFELKMKVRDYEVDCEGIVNNANYLHYLEHTRHEFCEQAGLSFREMHDSGIDPVVRRVEIDYLKPLKLGSEMVSKLNISRRGARFIFTQDIYHYPGGEQAIHALVTIVALRDGKLSRGEELENAFKPYIND